MRTAAERPDIHALLACLVGLVMAAPPEPAYAWSFPEHVHITALAFDRYLTPEARAVLAARLKSVSTTIRGSEELKSGLLPLCEELTIPFERLPSHEPRCIAFNVLPALAGDHSIDTESLRAALFPSKRRVPPVSASRYPRGATERRPLADVAFDVAEMFSAFLANAPREARRTFKEPTFDRARSDESGDDVRRMFLRQVDLYLRAEDPGYTDRAGGARAHFQDVSAPVEATISLAARAGDLDNALAQVLAHHLRSLQYAAKAGTDAKIVSEALLEHAFALHFLQDAFAAGHIGTEPAVFGDISRLRRHDYLNRVGLPVSRVMMRQSCHPDTIDADREAEQNCWTAYGDGYLDATNAIRTAEAAAHLSLQLAMAFDSNLAQNLLDACPSVTAAPTPKNTDTPQPPLFSIDARLASAGASTALEAQGTRVAQRSSTTTIASLPAAVHDADQQLIHHYSLELQRGDWIHIAGRSREFDIRLDLEKQGVGAWRISESSAVTTDEDAMFEVPNDGAFELSVRSENEGQHGSYSLRVERVDPEHQASCETTRSEPAPVKR